MLYKRAVAEGINERNIFEHEYSGAKIGDGYIEIEYSTDQPKIGTLGEKEYIVGSIGVYSNGYCSCETYDDRYKDTVCNDYKEISGDEFKDMMVSTINEDLDSIVCNEKDPSRWSRIKKYIADNNIELEYSEDLEAEEADYTKMPYEEDEELEQQSRETYEEMTGERYR